MDMSLTYVLRAYVFFVFVINLNICRAIFLSNFFHLTETGAIQMKRLSRYYQPVSVIPKDAEVKNAITSKSHKLMLELGLIKSISNGSYYILPLLQRSLEKCIRLIDYHMEEAGAQKISMPVLTPVDWWKKTGRYDKGVPDIMVTKDRHNRELILSPTHEEAVTQLVAHNSPISYKQLPLRVYQIGSKFRDEFKPRFGLLRAKEFIMKDCYSFDTCEATTLESYNQLQLSYDRIFTDVGVDFIKVAGDSGSMGGSISHEYHLKSAIGEDLLIQCNSCGYSANKELLTTECCTKCNSNDISISSAIEIGHTFILGTKYSKPLQATYLKDNGKPELLQMGCYGIGVSRLIAACLEVLSSDNELCWPLRLAPFNVCIIPPKNGSKEESIGKQWMHQLECYMKDYINVGSETVVDDRTHLTIGKRLLEAKRVGYPLIIVLGSKLMKEPKLFELHNLQTNITQELEFDALSSALDSFIHNTTISKS